MTDSACQEKHPGFLFSDRAWALKLLVALGLFSLLGVQTEEGRGQATLLVEESARPPEEVRGRQVQFWGHRVLSRSAGELSIDSETGPIRVTWEKPLLGDVQVVSGVGTILDRRLVRASFLRPSPGYSFKRGLTYGVSVLAVLGYLWAVRRRFRLSPEEGALRSRY